MNSIAGTAMNFTGNVKAGATPEQRRAALAQAAQEVVSTSFLGELMKISQKNPFKSKMFHGGRGEDMFQNQLNGELTRRASTVMKNGLSNAIVNRYARAAHAESADSQTE